MRASETRGFRVGALVVSCAVGSGLAVLAPRAAHYRVAGADSGSAPISLAGDSDDAELVMGAVPASSDHSPSLLRSIGAWRESAPPVGSSVLQTPPAMVSGTPDNPFSNTCDGQAIGFVTSDGAKPRMDFRNVPAGAVLECRTAPAATIDKQQFSACDGGTGSKPFHEPAFKAEGAHCTEVRYRTKDGVSATLRADYYVHRSLDRVACCAPTAPDASWFAAAQAAIKPAAPFDSMRLDNPFIVLSVASDKKELLSLRRTFRLSPDRRFLLIRRTMASRRTFELSKTNSCIGLSIGVPKFGLSSEPSCDETTMSPYRGPGAQVKPKCPDIYCTVTSCAKPSPACTQVTYTFNRGPGQKPWVIRRQPECAPETIQSTTPQTCDAYVLNQKGDAACLVNEAGKIRAAATIDGRGAAVGLTVLDSYYDPGTRRVRYVFSAKTTSDVKVKNVLNLPL